MMSLALAGSMMTAAQAQSSGGGGGGAAERGVSFVVGTTVGVFPSIFRSMAENEVNFTNDLTGRDASTFWKVAVQPLIVIPAVANGLFEGPIHAARNAWHYSATAPFSPQTFSLGPLD
jgi:hypothetical protein